ncbi:MAG: recombinase family protein [Intestinibacillus sp.]
MAKKLDADRIEKARQKVETVNNKERERKWLRDTIQKNRNGERKVTVIMPTKQDTANQSKKLRVAAYCRVSTAEEAQVGSFEMQIQHFNEVIENNPRYELVRIYKDEGISGTSVAKRKEFQEMLEAAQHGKIDLILTKSISRFGRNIVDILTSLRLLSDLSPPVVVSFETEGIDTADGRNNLMISMLSAFAELESQQKSEAIKAGIRYRMNEGIYKFAVQNTIGYYRDYTGAVKIEPAEAEIVRYIYDSFLEGASPQDIANALTQQGITSPKGMEHWRQDTIKGILSNEKYCGDVLYQKTYTKDFLTHKSVKNDNILIQYHWENCHPAIIERGKWDKAQELLIAKTWSTHRTKIKDIPKKFVVARVKSGRLRGFYLIDPAWNKEECSKFINILKSLNELEYSK